MFVSSLNPTPISSAAAPSSAQLVSCVEKLAATVAAQIAALQAHVARPSFFLLAVLLAPRTAARRRRIRQLRKTEALLAVMAEAFAGHAPLPVQPPAPKQAASDKAASDKAAPDEAAPTRRAARITRASFPQPRFSQRRANPRPPRNAPPTLNTMRHTPRPARAPSHTLRPASRASPAPRAA